ncbi:hypothetical protein KIPB_014330, partial [Kipferlia bialata]
VRRQRFGVDEIEAEFTGTDQAMGDGFEGTPMSRVGREGSFSATSRVGREGSFSATS